MIRGCCLSIYFVTALVMANEDTVLEEAVDNLKVAGVCIRATQNLMRSHGMRQGENHRDLLTRLFYGARHDRSCIPQGSSSEGSLVSRRVSTPQGYRRDADEPLAPGRRR